MNRTPHAWLRRLADAPVHAALLEGLEARHRVVLPAGHGSSPALLAGLLARRAARTVLLVVAHLDEADEAADDLALLEAAGLGLPVERFVALEVLPGETNVSLELLAQRLGVVARLADAGPGAAVVVAPIQALMQAVPRPEALHRYQLAVAEGQRLEPATLIEWLDRAGYQRNEVVEQPGDFATRGGIIDVFPPAAGIDDAGAVPGPIRLDYFGDEIESIRRIDTNTMGSGPGLGQVRIIGASLDQLQDDAGTTHLLELLGDRVLVVMHELMELAEQARGYYERLTNPRGIHAPDAVFRHLTTPAHVEINQYSAADPADLTLPLPVGQLMAFDQEAAKAIRELAELAEQAEVIVLCQGGAERQRLGELLAELAPERLDAIAIEVGYLHRGFTWDAGNAERPIVLVPHHELFHRYETRRRIRRISGSADTAHPSDAFVELEVGDHVVHVEHGIARFAGLRTMTRHGKTEEYLRLAFARSAMLHVPATQIHLVQKYIGGFQGKPPLSTLGGRRWARQKEAVTEAVQELASEMLRVQAARASLPGQRFGLDTAWQKEFEAAFPYTETDDQLATAAAVKRDMADEQPMDRLICGDVGFGKTEIAIRAAFKAAEHGKQVAVLVPTTVLAEQHERTFRDRMADYPFRIESLSRFKTAGEQKLLLSQLARGRIDMIIGTHRLLSKDVRFSDLGLVVIDEEQRFGVEHKQKLLQFRLTADVLTLTATPIPRTLHMAMLGLRDISSLATPPLDRRAIVTEVVPYDPQRIRMALVRELNRDGQAFFVHNRVHNIQSVADEVQRLAPDARVIVGHGQMPAGELERVMLAFTRREADILVCTTIIESGIDIPTANTIFINKADRFGLAELHQLRGRVGRYKHRAYCYLMLPPDGTITDIAARRLKALEQYAMLGAGFKIAMRDLEIRGAGNLLGAQQSGHIAAVGYEMYCMLLEQEAARLRQDKSAEPIRTHLELPMAGRLDRSYIPSERHRMDVYRRVSRANTLAELDAVVRDISDAYGPPPERARALLDLAEVRVAAGTLGIDALKLENQDLIFRTQDARRLDELLRNAPGRATVIDAATIYYRPPPSYLDPPATLLAVLRKLLVQPVRDG